MQSIKAKFYFYCILLTLTGSVFSNNTISGIVFDDLNKNGIMDYGEKGIAKVIVSNQRDVVITDDKGYFTLPLIDGRTVFVTKPPYYYLPLNNNNLPQFYYNYSSQGSPPGFQYKGLTANPNPPDTLYFPLYKTEYYESFKAIIVGDPQMRDSTEVDYFRDDVVAEMAGRNAVFYIALGDMAADNLSIYEQYNDVVGQLGIPVYNVPGNHDENYRAKNDSNALDTFKRIYGPEYYSFNYGKVHFAVLDIVDYAGWNYSGNKKGGYRGYLHQDQLTWLENDLHYVPDDVLIVLAMHIPIYTETSTSESVNLVNRDALFKIIQGRKHLLALSGHLHVIENLNLDQSVGWNSSIPFLSMNLGAGCGSWWSGPKDERDIPISLCMDGSPNGYYIFKFENNQFHQRFYPAVIDTKYQMRIFLSDESIKTDSKSGRQIFVNLFNADYETEVFCQIDKSERSQMVRKRMKDPFMITYVKKYKDKLPPWITGVPETNHIWICDLPENLASGQHIVKVSAIDGSNNIFSGVKLFDVGE